jgi:pyrimidine-nucleoside phosphorylase
MQMIHLIEKKRDGEALTEDEIRWFVEGVTSGVLPDYQIAALLMAIYFQGMSAHETTALTLAMATSGHQMDLSDITDYAVDKHSSGGVGDKTTLVVLPMVAALGVKVAKMSGRGLGFSGGTLDKLESIPGFQVALSEAQFKAIAREVGVVVCGQTADLAPADGKLYALRDVTGTVPSIPLIASSIMSKKLASGARGIVLDVKVGSGAFMPTLDRARQLAETMVQIGHGAQRDVIAVLSDMNQPLGCAVGNALEVREALACLSGGGPADLREHCLHIATLMLRLAGRGAAYADADAVRGELEEALSNGRALEKFRQMVAAQGGDVRVVDDPTRIQVAPITAELFCTAREPVYVAEVNALQVAKVALELGAGRLKKGDSIDLGVGVEVVAKVGDCVQPEALLARVYASSEAQLSSALASLEAAYRFSSDPVAPLPLFYGQIDYQSLV